MRIPLPPAIALVVAALFLSAAAAQEATPVAAPAAPADLVVQPGRLPIDLALDGLLAPVRTRKGTFDARTFGGNAQVAAVLPSGSVVGAGNLVLELESEELDKEIERALFDLDAARKELDWFDADTAVQEDEQRRRLEASERRLTAAVREQESFQKLAGPRWLEGTALGVKRSEYGLADQKEELAQLENMYKQSQLSSETQEIVLERGRRDVASAEKSLELTRIDSELTRLYSYPDRARDLAVAVDDRAAELARERESIRIARERRALERSRTRTRLDDAADRVERLRRDHAALRCSAPAGGILVHSVEPGDPVKAGQVLFTVQELGKLKIEVEVDAPVARALSEGSPVQAVPEDFPELAMSGKVARISAIARASEGKGRPARFPVEIVFDAPDSSLRPGQRCALAFPGAALGSVLAVPRKAVTVEGDAAFVQVRAADGAVSKRRVRLGAGNAESVQVVEGLRSGESVVVGESGK